MARRRDAVHSLDIKQVRANWKIKSVIICGLIISGLVGILTNPNVSYVTNPKPEPDPEPELDPEAEKIAHALLSSLNKKTTTLSNPTQNCHFASIQGRRSYQEDRVTCDLDLNIPFFGPNSGGIEAVKVGAVAVFDGHIGSAASDMASRIFLDKFLLKNYGEQSSNFTEFLKSSLVDTIEDIDVAFSKAAFEYHLYSGSTAVVALVYNNSKVLVANVGDSKAFICSASLAKELTRDHNADRSDERARVEASGGEFTPIYNAPDLLMGHFPMTRAIGDVPLKQYGIIATPEVTDWLQLTSKDEFLVVASDGIFDSLSPQKVCDFLNEAEGQHSDPSVLAQQLIQKAYLDGSTDNLSVVLVPLAYSGGSAVDDLPTDI
ncbi:probable protein phosphatase 2C 51 [Lycium ferocissimum]|uniref:probable protein phosphatase 2C 51 n=1 Tax=Lycium ferocissimum TaxID=112874 RepID=UPI0028165978|nr:probable protein phosphatase 2C 51 [Lycium ferocissimum]